MQLTDEQKKVYNLSDGQLKALGQIAAIVEAASDNKNYPIEKALREPRRMLTVGIQLNVKNHKKMFNRLTAALETWGEDAFPVQLFGIHQKESVKKAYQTEADAIQRNWKIENIRKEKGYTQTEWADELGVTKSVVEKWAQHLRNCPESILRLADTLPNKNSEGTPNQNNA